jgi:hypothetical protein
MLYVEESFGRRSDSGDQALRIFSHNLEHNSLFDYYYFEPAAEPGTLLTA